jgi:putative membrane protein
MRISFLAATAAALALAACGSRGNLPSGNDEIAADNAAVDNMLMDNGATPAAGPASGLDYATKAAASDLYEIQSAELAAREAKDSDVKALAAMLVRDHSKSTADLKTAAAKADPAIAVAPALDAEGSANMEALRNTADADFDRTFLTQQVAAHEKALAMVRAYAANGDVPSLKAHAAAVAGPVERHLQRARELSQRIGH